CQHYYSTPCSF
nr:immunoglobulin light chain junction region [Macaca mulatta]MPN91883.1 immunoglobulin light chain junction region [Macaca mulatta]MPN92029.1 immunoglobulin light chain junction region [Macaca mulatta]MPN92288.1 immunoglobulin light chain junction region [Macaca mulatta]MPN92519.1 immunoglobulin light chain junction region [Macaca mulatta]